MIDSKEINNTITSLNLILEYHNDISDKHFVGAVRDFKLRVESNWQFITLLKTEVYDEFSSKVVSLKDAANSIIQNKEGKSDELLYSDIEEITDKIKIILDITEIPFQVYSSLSWDKLFEEEHFQSREYREFKNQVSRNSNKLEELDKTVGRVNELGEVIDNVLSVEDVMKNTAFFHKESERLKEGADRDLTKSLVLTTVTIIFLIAIGYFSYKQDGLPITTWLYTSTITAMLIYITTIFSRRHYAGMHNYSVNRHKYNAFVSLLQIVGRSEKGQDRKELLNLGVEKIFEYHKTGYFRKEQDTPNPMSMFIKNMTSND